MAAIEYAKCPGCGDRGDLAHIVACVRLKEDEIIARGWRAGAEFVLEMVKTQIGRRGAVDVATLADAIEDIGGRRPPFR